MTPPATTPHPPALRRVGAVAALTLVGLSLRSPITSIAAVLPDIRTDHALSPTTAGLLTSLPVLCFGIGAVVVGRISRRFGLNAVMTASLALLALFVALRPFGGPVWLLLATAGTGLAITAGNVLLPVVVRRDFPRRQGPMLTLVTSSMIAGAALAAALTVPLWLWLGWRVSLAVWAVVVLLATLAYPVFAGPEVAEPESAGRGTSMWRVPGAWLLAVFFGLTSGLMYSTTHWLPTFLPEIAGADESQTGLAAAGFQFFALAGSLLVPILLTKVYHRQAVAMALTGLWPIYTFGMLFAPAWYPVWVVIGSLAQGGVWAMVLTLYILRAADLGAVRDISAMTQAVGYLISALTPVAIGAILEATGSWTWGLVMMCAMAVALVVMSPLVASRRKLGAPRSAPALGS